LQRTRSFAPSRRLTTPLPGPGAVQIVKRPASLRLARCAAAHDRADIGATAKVSRRPTAPRPAGASACTPPVLNHSSDPHVFALHLSPRTCRSAAPAQPLLRFPNTSPGTLPQQRDDSMTSGASQRHKSATQSRHYDRRHPGPPLLYTGNSGTPRRVPALVPVARRPAGCHCPPPIEQPRGQTALAISPWRRSHSEAVAAHTNLNQAEQYGSRSYKSVIFFKGSAALVLSTLDGDSQRRRPRRAAGRLVPLAGRRAPGMNHTTGN